MKKLLYLLHELGDVVLKLEDPDFSAQTSSSTAASVPAETINAGISAPRRAIEAWKAIREKQAEQDREFFRRLNRAIYRIAREREGLIPRSYARHDHEPRLPGESLEEYKARLHRDRQRTYRGTTPATLRNWTDLSSFTAEERLDHERKLARERQQKARARKRAAKENSSAE